jgi:hypothetical protein
MVSERNEQYLGWELVLHAINQTGCHTNSIAFHILHLSHRRSTATDKISKTSSCYTVIQVAPHKADHSTT